MSDRPTAGAAGRPRPPALMTLHQAAERLGVHYMTVYRWVRQGDLPAFRLGNRLRVRPADLDAFVEQRQVLGGEETATPSRRDWRKHQETLFERLRHGDEWAADEHVRTLIGSGASESRIYVDLLAPVMERFGAAWRSGDLTVAHEHRATAIVRGIIARLSPRFRSRDGGGVAVVLAPPGEHHALGAAMATDFVRAAGWEAHNLGADVPLDALRVIVREVDADLVVVSATRPLTAEIVEGLDAAADGADVVLGGPAANSVVDPPDGVLVEADMASLRARLDAHRGRRQDRADGPDAAG